MCRQYVLQSVDAAGTEEVQQHPTPVGQSPAHHGAELLGNSVISSYKVKRTKNTLIWSFIPVSLTCVEQSEMHSGLQGK